MPRRNKPKSGRRRAGPLAPCQGKPAYRVPEQAPKGAAVFACRKCGLWHAAKGRGR